MVGLETLERNEDGMVSGDYGMVGSRCFFFGVEDEKVKYRMMAVDRFLEKKRRRRMVVLKKKTVSVEKCHKGAVQEAGKNNSNSKKKNKINVDDKAGSEKKASRAIKKEEVKVQEEEKRKCMDDGFLPWVDACIYPYPYGCEGSQFQVPGGHDASCDNDNMAISMPCVFEQVHHGVTWCGLDGENTNAAASFEDLQWDHLFRTDSLFQCSVGESKTADDGHPGQIDNIQLLINNSDAIREGDFALASEEQAAEWVDDWIQSVVEMEQLDTSSVSQCESKNKKEAGSGGKKTKQKENLAVNRVEKKKRSGANGKPGKGNKGAGTVKKKKPKTVQVKNKKEEDSLMYVQDTYRAPSLSTDYVQRKEGGSKSDKSTQPQSDKDHDDGRNSHKSLSATFPQKRAVKRKSNNGNATKGGKDAKSACVKKGHGILGSPRRKGKKEKSTQTTPSHVESNVENRVRFPVIYPKTETKPFNVVNPVSPMYDFGVSSLPELRKCEQ